MSFASFDPEAIFRAISQTGGPRLQQSFARHEHALIRRLHAVGEREFAGPSRLLDRFLRSALRCKPTDEIRRAAVATLALNTYSYLRAARLPPSVAALYPAAFQPLARFLAGRRPYNKDAYARDVRLVAGMTAPMGAQAVDFAFPVGAGAAVGRLSRLGAMIGRLVLGGDLASAAKLIAAEGWKPWLQIHIDRRYLSQFNERGWDACYLRSAEILAGRPEVAGLLGVSWFCDPQLVKVSPHLAYLQVKPMRAGAIRVRIGAGPKHTRWAMQASPARGELVVAGRYRPVCYALFWPRRELLAWAASQSRAAPAAEPASAALGGAVVAA